MKKKKTEFFSLPSSKITVRYSIIAIFSIFFVAVVLPILLNYPPDSINTAFDVQMTGISYNTQYTIIGVGSLFLVFALVKILFKPIDKWFADTNPKKFKDKKRVKKVREKCFSLPYIIFFGEIIIPMVCVSFVLLVTNSHHLIMIGKILIIMLCFLLFFAVISYIFSKGLYNSFLIATYETNTDIGLRVSLTKKITMQILPICISGILITSLIAYSQTVKAKEDTLFSLYHKNLESYFDTSRTYTIDEIKYLLKNFEVYDSNHSKFIIKDNKEVINIDNDEISEFIVEYTTQIAEHHQGRTYDSYAVDTQGATIKLRTNEGYCYVGILYDSNAQSTIAVLFVDFIALIVLIIIVLVLFGKSLSEDISTITKGLNNIANSSKNFNLPVISNDEIGDLCISYNKVQKINDENIDKIKNSQDLLVERERLASLGQMIGGIAHNLKTPIMSISGAAEGIHDLTDELNRSIGNPVVTEEDYHAIAGDIDEWVSKIQTHTSYMSDVITAVKGQAVTFSETQVFPFTIEELFKQVDILMKHELKSALINLNVKNKVSNNVTINGNINSLVQIINNMISNSIQAYKGKPDSDIDLIANLVDNNVVISIVDNAGGLPDSIKNKLFKEMITTKGKDGTGLGLFMSYSNIKAHFQGNITFETKAGKGTKFNIIIPVNM
ncbi:MAG: histidine kinase [Clostridia bacterium]|nr:histidine kinase [Clostridia bacterium]